MADPYGIYFHQERGRHNIVRFLNYPNRLSRPFFQKCQEVCPRYTSAVAWPGRLPWRAPRAEADVGEKFPNFILLE